MFRPRCWPRYSGVRYSYLFVVSITVRSTWQLPPYVLSYPLTQLFPSTEAFIIASRCFLRPMLQLGKKAANATSRLASSAYSSFTGKKKIKVQKCSLKSLFLYKFLLFC